ncbi:endogenous retrovirus group K member 8 Gag polyprotein-like [Corvus hawaiiensis]|uniref:endogenous retrovirus group K member 8 Gag polyprotein-like n=1 Tax=Corvus hawaiiensis TaxID=134902 RepID=UPI002018B917|nr:endogenous retrovirus group K member 8 Gag polyprotein-like [Corvus hawaiiensis]
MQAAVTSGPCYFCKKPGHIMKNCPELKKGTQAPDRCPICKKGKHFAWQCRSRQDTNGKHSPKNSNTSAQCHRVTKQVVAPQTPKVAKDNPHTFRNDVSNHHQRQSKASFNSRLRICNYLFAHD